MTQKFSFWTITGILIIAMFAWSPWLTRHLAEARAASAFNKSWEFIIDGCGTNCNGCGVVNSRRVPFGMEITLEYGCGLMPKDSPQYHEQAIGFVSALGTVHGFPHP